MAQYMIVEHIWLIMFAPAVQRPAASDVQSLLPTVRKHSPRQISKLSVSIRYQWVGHRPGKRLNFSARIEDRPNSEHLTMIKDKT